LFPDGMFADPAWDMLLDLYACKIEGTRIGVSNACMAAGVPPTTALRCLNRLEQCGLVQRQPDAVDCRRIYVELTDIAAWRVELWLKTTFLPEAAA
jgi:DNA-binding MarR family transcriptional regulator